MIYFVTEDYLKDESPIAGNVDIKTVSPWIKPAVETRIKPMLGNYFFNDLLTKYNAQSLSTDETELVLMMKPCIAWRVAALAVYGVSRPLKNIGLQILDSENSRGVNLEEVTYGVEQYDRLAADYQRNLRDWLVENAYKFSKFTDPKNSDSSLYGKVNITSSDDDYTDTIMVI